MSKSFGFSDHEGRELVAVLVGEPGARRVDFVCRHPGPIPYGSVSLRELLNDPYGDKAWNGVLFPFGDLHASRENEIVMLDTGRIEQVACWAQEAALGRVESEEE